MVEDNRHRVKCMSRGGGEVNLSSHMVDFLKKKHRLFDINAPILNIMLFFSEEG